MFNVNKSQGVVTMAKNAYDELDDKNKPNVEALRSFRLKGQPVRKGDVISKDLFPNRKVWMNLEHMEPPKLRQTSKQVGPASREIEDKIEASMPGLENEEGDEEKSGKGWPFS